MKRIGSAKTDRSTSPGKQRLWAGLRSAILVLAVVMIPVMYSYISALTGPGSDSFQARTVEWGRDHHLGSIVDGVERYWYEHHPAKVGGAPSAGDAPRLAGTATVEVSPISRSGTSGGVEPVTTAAPGETSPTSPGTAGTTATAGSTAPAITTASLPGLSTTTTPVGAPAPLQTPAATPLAGEGVWSALGPMVRGQVAAYVTAIRPDSVHTSDLVAVVRFEPGLFTFRAYPGTKIPGSPWDRPDHVEPDRQAALVAAFAGGFRLRDSGGGMLLGGRQLQPMSNGVATFAIDKNGVPNVGAWGRDMGPSDALDSARQNLPLIVDNGVAAANLATDPNRVWGFTGPANKSAVWRSGAGVTASGALIWVGGPAMTISTLADVLIRAGVVRGMQLEINQEWVQFNTYVTKNGNTSGKRLLSGMQHTGSRWLTEDTRDFVAVFGPTS